MSTSASELKSAAATKVAVTDETLTVDLADGRTISIPLSWYPRLVHASPVERQKWQLIGRGEGIHWPDIDEDISVAALIAGHASGESQESLERWLKARAERPQA
jgi:hypothetical protein